MRITSTRWRLYANIYRALVVAQTLGWTVSTFVSVLTHRQRSALSASPIALRLTVGSAVAMACGVLAYYLRRSHSRDREAVVLTWAWLQIAGLLALIAYGIAGATICFIVGVATLVVMHVFSPNRFPTTPPDADMSRG
jgi:hypothetical protein